ncbi:NADP-dependent oxidoreductase domain-containing protein [Desarmillaria tabescens]|uniref:NADP-dependent oxidoreductase domain-containing protein n=1 Tax=Armillaria tabescens TaxID=1929756 RepID=A0AA39NBH5_ARMTA|nr:NADP-dependent oxidoreductase domain-containing protein [Desarmillaria tabescens]KAK0462549.1 NADP-dependent oxidoreductase domain-containing protein [Desarmillaria tabescens]
MPYGWSPTILFFLLTGHLSYPWCVGIEGVEDYPRLCRMSPDWFNWVQDEEESIRQIKAAYDAGINDFDTANIYSNGQSEVVLGKAIKEHKFSRDKIVVMTKMQARHDVVKAGYVRYIRMSNYRAWQFRVMQNYVLHNRLTPFISMQNDYNHLYREDEDEMFPTLTFQHFGVASVPWSALARGALVMPLSRQLALPNDDRYLSFMIASSTVHDALQNRWRPPGMAQYDHQVEEIAERRHITMTQVAIAWSLAREGICALVVGASSTDHLLNALGITFLLFLPSHGYGINVTLTPGEIHFVVHPLIVVRKENTMKRCMWIRKFKRTTEKRENNATGSYTCSLGRFTNIWRFKPGSGHWAEAAEDFRVSRSSVPLG